MNKTSHELILQLAAPYEHAHPTGVYWRGDAIRAASDDLSAFCGLAHMGGSKDEAIEATYRVSRRLKALADLFDHLDRESLPQLCAVSAEVAQ
ncbi:MAG: hypothetical protein U0174_23100 [Polyangiaceae bacterium]